MHLISSRLSSIFVHCFKLFMCFHPAALGYLHEFTPNLCSFTFSSRYTVPFTLNPLYLHTTHPWLQYTSLAVLKSHQLDSISWEFTYNCLYIFDRSQRWIFCLWLQLLINLLVLFTFNFVLGLFGHTSITSETFSPLSASLDAIPSSLRGLLGRFWFSPLCWVASPAPCHLRGYRGASIGLLPCTWHCCAATCYIIRH